MTIEVKEFDYPDFDSEFESLDVEKSNNAENIQFDLNQPSNSNTQLANNNTGDNQNENFVLDKETIKKELEAIIETTKAEALKQAELIKQQAKKEGFELGYKEGYEKGLNDSKGIFDKTIEEYTQKMQEAIGKLIRTANEISKKYEELENAAVEMVLDIAKKVILKELSEDRDVIKNMVKEAIGLSDSSKLKIKLNPEDAKALGDIGINSKEIEVVEDGSLKKGSLIIEEDNGNVIDASVDTKLKQIKESIVNE